MHHLKIMESLGGDLEWGDRFFAQHAAFFYYWILNLMFLISPKVAYNFSELIEMHAGESIRCRCHFFAELGVFQAVASPYGGCPDRGFCVTV